jgi:hypothetical protein
MFLLVLRREKAMALPQQQLDQLNMELQRHQEELADLQNGPQANQPDVRDEIAFHETALKIGRDQKLLAALGEMHDNPTLIDQLVSDPQKFVQSKGIQLPIGGSIVTSKRDPQSPVVGVNYHIGRYYYGFRWSMKGGFGTRRSSQDAHAPIGD